MSKRAFSDPQSTAARQNKRSRRIATAISGVVSAAKPSSLAGSLTYGAGREITRNRYGGNFSKRETARKVASATLVGATGSRVGSVVGSSVTALGNAGLKRAGLKARIDKNTAKQVGRVIGRTAGINAGYERIGKKKKIPQQRAFSSPLESQLIKMIERYIEE